MGVVRTIKKKEAVKTLESKIINGKVITLELRSDKLYTVREDGSKTLALSTTEAIAREKYDQIKPILEGGENMTDGEKKFKEAGEKLKADKAEAEEQALAKQEEVKNELEAMRNNPVLAKLYADNAKVGSENVSGETPQLKVHAVGRSQNELADGSEPHDGYFFYKPTQEEFESIEVHILTISRGFRAPSFENPSKETFNQIMGGVIVDNGDYKPFIMYFTGLKLSNLWDFGKQIKKYTHARPVGIPMFALTVKLSTEKKANNYGKSWIVNFEIVRNPDNTPKLVLDEGIFTFLKDNVETTEEMIEALINAKAVDKEDELDHVTAQPVHTAEVVNEPDENDFRAPEDLPFD